MVFQKFKMSLFKWKQTKNQTMPLNEELKKMINNINESHKAGKNIIKDYHLLSSLSTLLKGNTCFMGDVCVARIPWKITCWNQCGGTRCSGVWEVISVLTRIIRGLLPALPSAKWGDNEQLVVYKLEEGTYRNLTLLAPRSGSSNLWNCEK